MILDRAAAVLDFGQPVAVMLLGVLHLFQDAEDRWSIVAGLMAATAPGSYLTISHPAIDITTARRTRNGSATNASPRGGRCAPGSRWPGSSPASS